LTGRQPSAGTIGVGAALAVVVLLAGALAVVVRGDDHSAAGAVDDPDGKQIIVGEVDPPPAVDPPADGTPLGDGPGVDATADGRRLVPTREPVLRPGVLPPDGGPPGPPIPFRSDRSGIDRTMFVLVAGSDARPGEDVARTRADSIHVVAVNPSLGRGTLVGIPRDAWVDVPGHGKQKINSALSLGGPQLLARTVTEVTGMPIRYFVITGFDGMTRLTDDLGGVAVHLDRRMDDGNSGARFDRGWHHFTGAEALAFSRNRKDVAYGDFSRSEHQGIVMLATLAKMRSEIGDDGGLARWLDALRRHVQLDIGMDDVFALGVTARRLDPRAVANVVASGTVGSAGRQSVVFLDDDARAMFADVADDGVLRYPPPPYDPPGSRWEPAPSTTTTAPAPSATVLPSSTTTTTRPGSSTSTTGLLPIG
jgi:LCP family protein required for cell wall assembly